MDLCMESFNGTSDEINKLNFMLEDVTIGEAVNRLDKVQAVIDELLIAVKGNVVTGEIISKFIDSFGSYARGCLPMLYDTKNVSMGKKEISSESFMVDSKFTSTHSTLVIVDLQNIIDSSDDAKVKEITMNLLQWIDDRKSIDETQDIPYENLKKAYINIKQYLSAITSSLNNVSLDSNDNIQYNIVGSYLLAMYVAFTTLMERAREIQIDLSRSLEIQNISIDKDWM